MSQTHLLCNITALCAIPLFYRGLQKWKNIFLTSSSIPFFISECPLILSVIKRLNFCVKLSVIRFVYNISAKLDNKIIINTLMLAFELVSMGMRHKDSNEAFVDYSQELVRLAHLYLLVEYFDDLIPALTEHCYCLCVILCRHRDFSAVDRKSMVLGDCVVTVDFRNVFCAPRTMSNLRLVVVDS